MKNWMELAKIMVWSISIIIFIIILSVMFCAAKTPEIQNLILVLAFGTILAFGATRIDKWLDQNIQKERTIMFLKIELRRIKPDIDVFIKVQTVIGHSVPAHDIPELNVSAEVQQIMSYERELAEKVYKLSTCLKAANKNRETAYPLRTNPSDSIFQMSFQAFLGRLEEAQKLLNEINEMIHFEENSPKS